LIYHNESFNRVSKIDIENLDKSSVKQFLDWTPVKLDNINSLIICHNKIKSYENIPFNYILVQYGVTINKSTYLFNKKIELVSNRIKVNANYCTNIANIFAAGDCCSYQGKEYTIKSGMLEIDKILKNI
jgi:thioredoxin reductase (NADPH)